MNMHVVTVVFFSLLSMFVRATQDYERPMVVVVPSYNNAQWYEKNLESIFSQKYDNYRVIYIDDCSQDGTYELVKEYVGVCGQENRVTVIANTTRRGALANHYKAVHQCADHEIVVQLDGDDWFAHNEVLARVNKAYENSNIWMTYGQYEVYPSGKKGQCKLVPYGVFKKCAYREYEWVTSALRTFYAGLFKKIKLQDLLENGDFFKAGCDLACMLPMLEMANGKVRFIDDILYIYNCKTSLNDHKKNLQLQRHCEYVIRGRDKYEPLKSLWSNARADGGSNVRGDSVGSAQLPVVDCVASSSTLNGKHEGCSNAQNKVCGDGLIQTQYELPSGSKGKLLGNAQHDGVSSAGILIFSENNPTQLRKCLATMQDRFINHGCVTVLYQANSEQVIREYEGLAREYSAQIEVVDATVNLKNKMLELLAQKTEEYLLLLRDTDYENLTNIKIVDLCSCVSALRATHAHGFFLLLDVHKKTTKFLSRDLRLPSFINVADGVCAWQFKDGEYEWAAANCFAAALYPKSLFLQSVSDLCFDSFDQLAHGWQAYAVDSNAVGLCFN